MLAILTTVVDRQLVESSRLFGELGYEWRTHFGENIEVLIYSLTEGEPFLTHLDRREELLQAIHKVFMA